MINSLSAIQQTTIVYLPKYRKTGSYVYWLITFFIVTILASFPFVNTNISITSQGIIRPQQERTEIKPIITGIIDSIFYKEGDTIQKDAIILRLKDDNSSGKRIVNQFEITQRQQFIHDLSILGDTTNINEAILSQLSSPLYKGQLSRFLHQLVDQEATLKKAQRELETNTKLAKDKVISPKEFFDTQIQNEKLAATYKAFRQEQLSNWQQDLAKYRLDLSQYQDQLRQVNVSAAYYYVKAPATGIIQNINTRYAGGLLQANEMLCSISPLGTLIGECYVTSRDIGLLQQGQQARFQIDAFDYKYFGVATGRVISIDKDYSVVDNKPVFKARCLFDSGHLYLKNGYTAYLSKGLTFQARFTVARRSLWQLLWDKVDNWLNPASPKSAA